MLQREEHPFNGGSTIRLSFTGFFSSAWRQHPARRFSAVSADRVTTCSVGCQLRRQQDHDMDSEMERFRCRTRGPSHRLTLSSFSFTSPSRLTPSPATVGRSRHSTCTPGPLATRASTKPARAAARANPLAGTGTRGWKAARYKRGTRKAP